jgi:hypothetical protein
MSGSGSVGFHKANGFIHVPTQAKAWQSIVGIRGEVTLRREPSTHGFMIGSDSFQFYVRSDMLNGWFSSYPTHYAQVNSFWDPAGSGPYRLPVGRWVTVGFMHDGFGTMELYADGELVAQRNGVYHPVNPPGGAGLSIGNDMSGGVCLNGQIDQVKIWRLNPRQIHEDFLARDMDAETADCWKRFLKALEEALARDPDCARRIGAALKEAMDSLIRQALAMGPETRKRLEMSVQEYKRLWRVGKVDSAEMAKVFADLIAWLRLVGVPLETNPAIMELNNSECLKRILAELKPPDCDPQAMKLLQSIAASLAGSGGGEASAA